MGKFISTHRIEIRSFGGALLMIVIVVALLYMGRRQKPPF
jgi:hypothetical protein